jgi:hypothetical protein
VNVFLYLDSKVEAWIESSSQSVGWETVENEEGGYYHHHGYGRAPVFPMRNIVSRGGGIYGPRVGGDDMLENVGTLAKQWTTLGEETIHQRGQAVLIGGEKGKAIDVVHSPRHTVRCPRGGDFKHVPNAANLPGMESSIQLQREGLAVGEGASPESVRLKSSATESGAAILARRARQRDRTKKREKVGRRWEQDSLDLGAVLVKTHKAETLSTEFEIAYPAPAPVYTVEQKIALGNFLLDRGIASKEWVARFVFGDMPQEELDAMLEQAEEEQEQDVAERALVAGHAEDIPPPAPQPEQTEELDA